MCDNQCSSLGGGYYNGYSECYGDTTQRIGREESSIKKQKKYFVTLEEERLSREIKKRNQQEVIQHKEHLLSKLDSTEQKIKLELPNIIVGKKYHTITVGMWIDGDNITIEDLKKIKKIPGVKHISQMPDVVTKIYID